MLSILSSIHIPTSLTTHILNTYLHYTYMIYPIHHTSIPILILIHVNISSHYITAYISSSINLSHIYSLSSIIHLYTINHLSLYTLTLHTYSSQLYISLHHISIYIYYTLSIYTSLLVFYIIITILHPIPLSVYHLLSIYLLATYTKSPFSSSVLYLLITICLHITISSSICHILNYTQYLTIHQSYTIYILCITHH